MKLTTLFELAAVLLLSPIAPSLIAQSSAALRLDGNDDVVIITNFASFPSKAVTVEFWMRTLIYKAGTPVSYAAVEGGVTNANALYVFDCRNFQLAINGVTTGPTAVSAADQQWHHIAMTWTNSGEIAFYKDGSLVYSRSSFAVGTFLAPGGVLALGQEQDAFGGGFDPAQAFAGDLDEVRIWNVARPAGEIATNYNRGIAPDEPGLVLYLRFNEGAGAVVGNLASSESLTGQIIGGASWVNGAPLPPEPPVILGLRDVSVNQGSSASLPITVLDGDTPIDQVTLSITSDNYVLLPNTNIALAGVGAARTLTLVPAANFSGSSHVTVTASDEQGATATSFDVTVAPLGAPNPLLALGPPLIVSPQQVRLRFADAGTGMTNYVVEARSDLNTAGWFPVSASIAALGNGIFEAAIAAAAGDTAFYRVRGAMKPMANFDTQAVSLEEGNTTAAVIVLSQPFTGTLRYTVSGTAGSGDFVALSGTVFVNGTTATIPIQLLDDNIAGPVRSLTLTLSADGAYVIGNGGSFTLLVDDDDSEWSGTLLGANGNVGVWVELKRLAGQWQGTVRANGALPTNAAPLQVSFTTNSFFGAANNLTTPGTNTLFNSPLTLKLTLTAQNGLTNQAVSATEIDGQMTLAVLNQQMPALSFTNRGTFVLFKAPQKPATNQVTLTIVQ